MMRLAAAAGSSSFLFAALLVACVRLSAATQRPRMGRRHQFGSASGAAGSMVPPSVAGMGSRGRGRTASQRASPQRPRRQSEDKQNEKGS